MLKSDANAELVTAINRVRRGEQYFTGCLASTMAESFALTKSDGSDDSVIAGTSLTPREAEIIQLLAQGKSNKEAAAAHVSRLVRSRAIVLTSCTKWNSKALAYGALCYSQKLGRAVATDNGERAVRVPSTNGEQTDASRPAFRPEAVDVSSWDARRDVLC